nr:DUF6809 family protein [Paenibacillus riograndensis]
MEKFIDLLGQSTSMYSAAAYKEGFRLGALMMIEVMGAEGKAVGDSRE